MEKLTKYCSACGESFAKTYSFCPKCAAILGESITNPGNDSYQITIVETTKNKKRGLFLLGAAFLVLGGTGFSLIGSIYNADIYVNALDDSLLYLANISNEDPYQMEELDLPSDKKKGGGGEGGDKNKNPVSKGELADQTDNPLISTSVSMAKVTNPSIKIIMQTKGVVKRKLTDQPYGEKNSQYNVLSDGDGENGGQGNGSDRGQGTGKGPGSGPGEGPGVGPGPGGPGLGKTAKTTPPIEKDEPPKMVPNSGPTIAMKILSKPRAIYTDAARRNQLAGTVTLRVTFQANGSIGNIIAISGLPDGLTEQAIAAARNIQFEPARRNGVAQTVTKQVQYTFTLY